MRVLIKLYRTDVESLLEHIAPDSDFRSAPKTFKVQGSPQRIRYRHTRYRHCLRDAEARKLLLIARERCSHRAVQEIQRG